MLPYKTVNMSSPRLRIPLLRSSHWDHGYRIAKNPRGMRPTIISKNDGEDHIPCLEPMPPGGY
jgi:hypothetical protein